MTPTKTILSAAGLSLLLAAPACAADKPSTEPPGGAYQPVSALVALPDFIPGLGALYVDPASLPVGPFLAYDRDHRLVSTIYMVPLADLEAHQEIEDLAVGDETTKSVELHYNAGHPGVEEPHYHIVLWHVDEDAAKLE